MPKPRASSFVIRASSLIRASGFVIRISLIPALLVAPAARAQDPTPANIAERPNQVRGDELNDAQRRAVERGLAALAARQVQTGPMAGSFGDGGAGYGAFTGITALSGIAFMAAGNLPGRGKYGDNVKRAVDFILNSSQQSGLLSADSVHGVMSSHGFATLFLGEVYGMTGDDSVKEKLQLAVRLIEKSQNSAGGWRYMPVPADADISVTICQVMALRAARDAGIKVEKKVIDNAIKYVHSCQNFDGGFSYTASFGGGGGSGFERSAAGVAALYYAGEFEGNDIKRGLDFVFQFKPGAGMGRGAASHYFYGQYYAAQAMFLAGGDFWGQWYPAIRDELILKQEKSGLWNQEVSPEYCTAIALIVLQMPNRYLPVFNGKGPGG